MTGQPKTISTADYHTAGEPFRIVLGGVRPPQGATILDKRDDAIARLDDVRKLLTLEPRGHADMYGCFVTEPDDDGADLGLVFFHREGFSTACGHGSIAAAVWASTTGYAAPREDGTLVLDVPSGRVTCHLGDEGGHPSVRFVNIPSYLHAKDVKVSTTHGTTHADIAYGGAFYAMVEAGSLGQEVTPAHLPRLIALSAQIKADIVARHRLAGPEDDRVNGLYGVIFYDRLATEDGRIEERNVTVFADGQVDRSPCGSGTCARLATLHGRGQLGTGELVNRSIIDTVFTGRVAETTTLAGRPAIIPEVTGTAHLTGYSTFVVEAGDDLPLGFLLPTASADH
ncbi:proline racemase family protein [Streptomyces sp. NPDC047985]|uniref:proline racemase family protein n=1 Tax=Streptomyces sp. NPDC047985 TaxID=3155384 RepID=UPI003415B065